MYLIRNANDHDLYWKSGLGWGSRDGANSFTNHDKERLPLPPNGEWLKLPTIGFVEAEEQPR